MLVSYIPSSSILRLLYPIAKLTRATAAVMVSPCLQYSMLIPVRTSLLPAIQYEETRR